MLFRSEFKEGDWVRMRSDKPQGEALKQGIPLKWVHRWKEKGTVVERVPGHPDQYLVRKANSGRIVKRSGRTLSKIPMPDEVLNIQESAYSHHFCKMNDEREVFNCEKLFL